MYTIFSSVYSFSYLISQGLGCKNKSFYCIFLIKLCSFEKYLLKCSSERGDNFTVWKSFYVLSVFVYIKFLIPFSKDVCRVNLWKIYPFTLIKVQLVIWNFLFPTLSSGAFMTNRGFTERNHDIMRNPERCIWRLINN